VQKPRLEPPRARELDAVAREGRNVLEPRGREEAVAREDLGGRRAAVFEIRLYDG